MRWPWPRVSTAVAVVVAVLVILLVLTTRGDGSRDVALETASSFECPYGLSFVSTRTGRKQIYAIDVRRPQRVTQVTRLAGEALDPTWSPDGKQLAFRLFDPKDSTVGLYVASQDGSGVRLLVEGGVTPSWSPDGRLIAHAGSRGISVVDVARASHGPANASRRLTRTAAENPNEYPTWSPDGRRLAFAGYQRNGGAGSYDIWVLNADGSGLRNVTRHPALDYGASWMGDGKRIVFGSLRESTLERGEDLFVMDADGTDVELLLRGAGAPATSPDGRWIAFSSDRESEGNSDIFLMRADGSALRQLTNDPEGDYSPAWIGRCS